MDERGGVGGRSRGVFFENEKENENEKEKDFGEVALR